MVRDRNQPVPSRMQSIRTVMEGLTVSGVGAIFILLWNLNGSLNEQGKQIVKLQVQLEVMQQLASQAQTQLPAITMSVTELKMQMQESHRRLSELENDRKGEK